MGQTRERGGVRRRGAPAVGSGSPGLRVLPTPLGRFVSSGDLARCRGGGGGPEANNDEKIVWGEEAGVCVPERIPSIPSPNSSWRVSSCSPLPRPLRGQGRRLSGGGPDIQSRPQHRKQNEN